MPMLRLGLAQEPRLLEIAANTRQRLGEAQRMQWLVRSPVCRRACGTSPTRDSRSNACELKPTEGKGRGRLPWLGDHASAMIRAFRRSYSATASGT